MLHFQEFLNTLPIMLYGMAGVFIVILLVALAVKLLCWALPKDE